MLSRFSLLNCVQLDIICYPKLSTLFTTKKVEVISGALFLLFQCAFHALGPKISGMEHDKNNRSCAFFYCFLA